MNDEVEQIWSHIQAELRDAVDETTYGVWLEPLALVELSGQTLTVASPTQAAAWVRERFGRLLQTCAAAVLGPDIALDIIADNGPRTSPRRQLDPGGAQGKRSGNSPTYGDDGLWLNPKLTFDQFVIGDSNRLAHAAALAVAEMPSQAYNPLFICGPPGVGKTHLLHSVGSLLLAHNPGLIIRYTTGETFTNDFLAAIAGGHMESFKAQFRSCDVLLVDDVQFLERKVKTEEEFFHTFNALHDIGSQIVLSSDRTPDDLQALESRMRERFKAGLVADIAPPGPTTRLAILRKRAHYDRIDIPDGGVLPLIAQTITRNVRELEGALIRVVAYGSLTGRELSTDLAEEVLHSLYPHQGDINRRSGTTTISQITQATCEHFGLTADELISPTRQARIAWPRQLAMYLSRELTSESLPSIGRHFGGRDHSTVLHAWKRADKRISTDPTCRTTVDKLRARITNSTHDRTA